MEDINLNIYDKEEAVIKPKIKESFQRKVYDILGPISGPIQNRISPFLTAFGFYGLFRDHSNFASTILQQNIDSSSVEVVGEFIRYLYAGIAFGGAIALGESTHKSYRDTHMMLSKGYDLSNIFSHFILKKPITGFFGYCTLQGIYLASKEYGLEEEFFRLRDKLTNNKIPNF